ncbi:hypothetical protein JCM5350_007950, partial [Sporobolomyces pararoseus]
LETAFHHQKSTSSNNNSIIIQLSTTESSVRNPSSSSYIDQESVSIVLASMYSPKVLLHLNKLNCKEVLKTFEWFGLRKLISFTKKFCRKVLEGIESVDEFHDWIEYLFSNNDDDQDEDEEVGLLSLKEILFQRLKNLPIEFKAFYQDLAGDQEQQQGTARGGGQEILIQVLRVLPFEWFKIVLENQDFKIPSEMDRFNFAKKCVKARKQYFNSLQLLQSPSSYCCPSSTSTASNTAISATSTSSFSSSLVLPSPSPLPNSPPLTTTTTTTTTTNNRWTPETTTTTTTTASFEETVVLGFDSGGKSSVKILRKPIKKGVQYWKIGPSNTITNPTVGGGR